MFKMKIKFNKVLGITIAAKTQEELEKKLKNVGKVYSLKVFKGDNLFYQYF